jgi:hypothetical protein
VVGRERAEPLKVGILDREALAGEVVERALGVDRVVEDDRVDVAGEGVTALAAVELGQDAPPDRLVIAVVEEVDRLRGAPDVLQRAGEGSEVAGVAAQRADELAGGCVAL